MRSAPSPTTGTSPTRSTRAGGSRARPRSARTWCARCPRLMRTPKAATMGVGRFVLLEPNVQKLLLELDEPSLEDPRSHLRRVHDALVVEGLEVSHGPAILPRLALVLEEGVHDAHRDRRRRPPGGRGGRATRASGCSASRSTSAPRPSWPPSSTCASGAVAAVASTINRQATFGADVIARMGHAMTGPEAIEELRDASSTTVNGLLDEAFAAGGVAREQVYEAVVVGNATMLHLLLGIDPRSIALSPFVATFLEAAGPARRRRRVRASTPRAALHCSRRSARTWAPTSWATWWPPASRASRRSGCWWTSARTARSCAATRTASWPPRRRPVRRSRAARSCAGCGPPTARSRAWSSRTARSSSR